MIDLFSRIVTPRATDKREAVVRNARWLELDNGDPRVPPAVMIDFATTAFTLAAFERHGVPFPTQLRKAVPKRQAEFLMGRIAARHAVERLGVVALPLGIGRSREPLWPTGVTGSITHTSETAGAVAVASSGVNGIGIDIETVIDADHRHAVQEYVVAPSERHLLERQCGPLSADVLLTLAFSAKESFFKATFAVVGRYFDFTAARLSAVDASSGRVTLTLAETLCPTLPVGRSFTVCFKLLRADTVVTSFVW